MGPSQKATKAVLRREAFLRETGYIDNPKELLYQRFHGTSAEKERSQNSEQMAAQKAAAETMTEEQQRLIFRNCWRTNKPIPKLYQPLVHNPASAEAADPLQLWRHQRLHELPAVKDAEEGQREAPVAAAARSGRTATRALGRARDF